MNYASLLRTAEPKDQKRNGFDYNAVLLRPIQGIWQLHSIKDYKDERFGKPEYGFMKVRYVFVRIIEGADKATTEAEQTKFRQLGHGKFLSIEVNPVCTPPRLSAKGETMKASGMYNLHCVLLNDGDPLTEEQLGEADDATVKSWVAVYNAASEAGDHAKLADISGMGVEDFLAVPAEVGLRGKIEGAKYSRARYAAAILGRQIAAIEAAHPQVYATPDTKTSVEKPGRPSRKYNVLRKVDSLVPADAAIEGGYKPFAKPYDEREADDNPLITCADCGRPTRGYERRVDQVWVSNEQASATSIEKFGRVVCGSCFVAAKAAQEAEG